MMMSTPELPLFHPTSGLCAALQAASYRLHAATGHIIASSCVELLLFPIFWQLR